jgi:serine/threonine protein kinase
MLIQCNFYFSNLHENPSFKFNRNTTACGTLDYLAPEIVGHKQYQYQVDNWCVGVLGYELLAGRAPFEGTDDETKSKIANINYKFPDYFSQPARRFIDNVNNSERLKKKTRFVLAFTKRSEKTYATS